MFSVSKASVLKRLQRSVASFQCQSRRCLLILRYNIASSVTARHQLFEAERLSRHLWLCYTPKHGSSLNMVSEIELSVFTRQCLWHRRIADIETLRSDTTPWATHRNAVAKPVNWRFTTKDARIRLKRLSDFGVKTQCFSFGM